MQSYYSGEADSDHSWHKFEVLVGCLSEGRFSHELKHKASMFCFRSKFGPWTISQAA